MRTLALLLLIAGISAIAADKKPMGPTLDARFAKLDTDKDGKLSFAEFKGLVPPTKEKEPQPGKKKQEPTAPPDLAGIYSLLDKNRDNQLTLDEFRKLPTVLTTAPQKSKKAK